MWLWKLGWNIWKHWHRLFLKISGWLYRDYEHDYSFLREVSDKSDAWNLMAGEIVWERDSWWMLFDAIQHPNMLLYRDRGDCIPGYESLWVKENNKVLKKKMADIQLGDLVLSYDFKNERLQYKPVIKKWSSGEKQIYRVHYKNGSCSDFSKDHRIFTRTKHGAYTETKVEDIIISRSRFWTRKVPVIKELPYDPIDEKLLTKDVCFLIGYFFADGWVEKKKKRVRIGGHNVRKHILPILNRIDPAYSISVRSKDSLPTIEFLKTSWLREILFAFKSDSKEMYPEKLINLPKEKLKAVLEGLAAGDGSRSERSLTYNTVSNSLKDFIVEAFYRIGNPVSASLLVNHGGFGKNPIWRITDDKNSFYKRDYGYSQISESSVKKVEPLEEYVDMYDIEVGDNHNFVMASSGTIVHNCDDFAYLAFWTFGPSLRHNDEPFLFAGFYLIIAENPTENHMVCVYKSANNYIVFSNNNFHLRSSRNIKSFLLDNYSPRYIAKIDAKLNIMDMQDWYNFKP